MKKLNVLLAVCIGLFLSCSSDGTSTSNNPLPKRLTKVIYNREDGSLFTQNFVYNSQGLITELNDNITGSVTAKYVYNASNQLEREEFYDYTSTNALEEKRITSYTYNIEGKIASLFEETTETGFSTYSNSYEVTYGTNTITRTLVEDFNSEMVIFGLNTEGKVSSIKITRNGIVVADMSFTYDADGNCISGSGPINEGSFDATTDNINLSVIYGANLKNSLFNSGNIFYNNLLSCEASFENYREVLIKNQGNKYAIEIQWYQFEDYTYKETNVYTFDSDNYPLSILVSELPNYPNYVTLQYIWE